MNYIGNGIRPGVSLGVLGYPGVSWGNQTDPMFWQTFLQEFVSNLPFISMILFYQPSLGINILYKKITANSSALFQFQS